MRTVQAIAVIIGLLFSLTANAQQTQEPMEIHKIEPLPRDLEIQLALSALPPHLRDSATVYILNPDKGFEVTREGTNGFHTFVSRTGEDTMRGSWPLNKYRDDILYPISFDQAGAKANMQVFFDIAEMQAQGTPPNKLKQVIKKRYETGYYKAPKRAGISYMLSPILRTYTNPDENESVATANVPHVMHYAPYVSNEEIGGATPTVKQLDYFSQHGHWPDSPYQYPFVITHGPHGYVVQFMGRIERTAINKAYEEMLAQLCEIKEEWCLPMSNDQ